MKKLVITILSVLLLLTLACPAFAVSDIAAPANFVPSITYKDGLPILDADIHLEFSGNNWSSDIGECLIVTSVAQAQDKSTDISQEERDHLLEVYDALVSDEMELPLDFDYVIRDLVDLNFKYDDCRCLEEHGHKDECFEEEGSTLDLTFDLGVAPGVEVIVMTYTDGKWVRVEHVINNGDGTVDCTFDTLGPITFVVNESSNADIPSTGDTLGGEMSIWIAVMGVCVVGIVLLLVLKRRKNS